MSCQALHRDSKMRVPAPKPLFGQLPSTSLRYRAVACPAQPKERQSRACTVADHQDHFRSTRLIQDTRLAHGNKSERDSIALNHSIEVSPIFGQRHAAFSHHAFQARTARLPTFPEREGRFQATRGQGIPIPSTRRRRHTRPSIGISPPRASALLGHWASGSPATAVGACRGGAGFKLDDAGR